MLVQAVSPPGKSSCAPAEVHMAGSAPWSQPVQSSQIRALICWINVLPAGREKLISSAVKAGAQQGCTQGWLQE